MIYGSPILPADVHNLNSKEGLRGCFGSSDKNWRTKTSFFTIKESYKKHAPIVKFRGTICSRCGPFVVCSGSHISASADIGRLISAPSRAHCWYNLPTRYMPQNWQWAAQLRVKFFGRPESICARYPVIKCPLILAEPLGVILVCHTSVRNILVFCFAPVKQCKCWRGHVGGCLG